MFIFSAVHSAKIDINDRADVQGTDWGEKAPTFDKSPFHVLPVYMYNCSGILGIIIFDSILN